VMGAHRPYAPPEAFWRTHTVLLFARLGTPPASGNFDASLQTVGVDQRAGRIRVATHFAAAAPGSETVKFWTAAAVQRPLAASMAEFTDRGQTICTVQLTAAQRGARSRRR
jgi:hypothetical protein